MSSAGDGASEICRSWQLRTRTIRFDNAPTSGGMPLPRLMGIVNVTPDSFSDGGNFLAVDAAVTQALRLEDAGADILDIGGESTRPYSDPVAVEEELRRVVPVLQRLQQRLSIPISIDTSKSRVARAAVQEGAEIINDVTGLTGDPEMMDTAIELQVGVCAMHMQGTPQTMQDAPTYRDVVADIRDFLADRANKLKARGIATTRICLDPGIGFGKTHEHNLELVRNCRSFLSLGHPILVGHSRKGFVAKLIGDKQRSRDAGTLGISLALAQQGVQLLRVHDVAATRDALLCFAASSKVSSAEDTTGDSLGRKSSV